MMKKFWDISVVGDPMTRVMKKLKGLIVILRSWIVTLLRNVHLLIREAVNRLLEVQQQILNEGFSDALFHEEVDAHRMMDGLLSR